MHIHVPKPLHGWREFAGEIGVIVIGILIALAMDQFVERLGWRREVREATEDLHSELETNLFNAQERVKLAPCIDRRLDQLEAIVDHPPAKSWKLLPDHGVTPMRVWSASGWDSAVAAGTVPHMRSKERAQYAGVYAFVRGLQSLAREEFAVTTEFQMLEHGGPLSEVSQDRLRANIARVRGYNRVMALGGTQISHQIRSLGVELSPESRKQLDELACPMPADTLPGT
jgi:hypothetical protein